MAHPMDRKNVTAPAATPMSFISTEFCTAVVTVCMLKPSPAPQMKVYSAISP
jgi:hypothetical protein